MAQTYTVQKGDSLSKIAQKLGVGGWQQLYEANKSVIGSNPSKIYAGQVLDYSFASSPAPASGGGSPAPSTGLLTTEQVNAIYKKLLGRDADPTGLGTYTKFPTTSAVEQSIMASDEYATYQKNLTSPASKDVAQSALSQLTTAEFTKLTEAASPPVRTTDEIRTEVEDLLKPSVAKPEAPDYTKLFESLSAKAGVEDLETKINDLSATEEALNAEFRKLTEDEEGKPILTSLITGRNAKYARNLQRQLDDVGRQKARYVDQVNTKLKTIDTIMNLTEKDYDTAKAEYDDAYKQNVDMINYIRNVKEDEQDDIEKDRTAALANLQTIAKYIEAGTIDFTSLPADRQLEINKLEIKSGLGAGFLEAITPKLEGADIKSITTRDGADGYKYADMVIVQPDGTIKVMSEKLGKYKQTGGTATVSKEEKEITAFRNEASGLIKDLDAGDIEWGAAFDSLKAKYPNASNALIDSTLGGGYDSKTGTWWGRAKQD
mgnify:CR=1 FL=1